MLLLDAFIPSESSSTIGGLGIDIAALAAMSIAPAAVAKTEYYAELSMLDYRKSRAFGNALGIVSGSA